VIRRDAKASLAGPPGSGLAALTTFTVLVGLVARQRRGHRERTERRALAAPIRDAAVRAGLAEAGSSTTTHQEPCIVVVMAAYEEAGSLAGVLAALPERLCGLPVRPVVVDDGSRDDTAVEARKAGAVVCTHRRNLGQGDALRTGFDVARGLGARVVVTMDADGQHDPGELKALVEPVVSGAAQYVQGSRFLGEYDDAGGARDVGIRIFTALINALTQARITDCTNGYRTIDAQALDRLRLVEDRFSASEILVQAAANGLVIREVAVHIRRRETGCSKKPRGARYAAGYLGAIIRSWTRAQGSRSQVRAGA